MFRHYIRYFLVLSCPRLHMHYQLSQANSQLMIETGYVLYHERFSVAALHILLLIEEIIDSADRKFFNRIMHQPGHCLYHLLPPKTSVYCPYNLCKRQHSYQLPHIEFSPHKNSFINRCLFKFRWLLYFRFSLFHVLPYVYICLAFSFNLFFINSLLQCACVILN